jgi:hypothetical protein
VFVGDDPGEVALPTGTGVGGGALAGANTASSKQAVAVPSGCKVRRMRAERASDGACTAPVARGDHAAPDARLLSGDSIWLPEPSLLAYQLTRIDTEPLPSTRPIAAAAYHAPPSTGGVRVPVGVRVGLAVRVAVCATVGVPDTDPCPPVDVDVDVAVAAGSAGVAVSSAAGVAVGVGVRVGGGGTISRVASSIVMAPEPTDLNVRDT